MRTRHFGLLLGAGLFALILVLPTPAGATPEAMRAAAVTCLMAVWWVTEAIPISATALIPLVLFPLLGVLDASTTAANYGHNYVLMLLGGFFLAKAIELQQLHRRIALWTLKVLGHSRRGIVFSFMLATALLSMWIANVAVTLLMLPIALAMVDQEEETAGGGASRFGLALMLAIAYAASIGGTGTLIGTPPNMVFAGMVKTLYPQAPDISFMQWMVLGIPLVIVLLPVTWLYLLRYFQIRGSFPGSREIVESQLTEMGPMTPGERRVGAVFVLTALGWMFRKNLVLGDFTIAGWSSMLGVEEWVHDSTVALAAALLLFLIPAGGTSRSRPLLDWKSAESVPWGVVIIVGGGYAIAGGFASTGLSSWIGQQVQFLAVLPTLAVVLAVVAATTFLTEVNSNTATANIFLPVLATVAAVNGMHPFLLMIPATIACSCAFCLPSGTGTNAVVFASGRVTIPKMARCGFLLNFITIVIVTVLVYLVGVPLFGISGGVPTWASN